MDKQLAMHRLFFGALFLLFVFSSSCQRQLQPQQAEIQKPVSTLKPFAATVSPQLRQLVESAIEQTRITIGHDPSYVRIDYPGGDLPIETWSENRNAYLVVHNIGAGARVEDVLFSWKITGHYRYF